VKNNSLKPAKANREPLIYITKRSDISKLNGILIKAAVIVVGILVCALITVLLTGENPMKVFASMIKGSFGSERKFWNLLQSSAMLLGISLAVTPAFKMRFWNTGAEGQVLIGMLASVACMFYLKDSLPSWLLLIIMFVASVVAGAIWAGIPGFFKAFLGVNEVIVCIMTNWIAANVVSWVFSVNKQFINTAGGKTAYTLPTTANGVSTPKLGLNKIFPGSNIDIGIFIAILIAVGIFILMNKTTLGYELKACGHNKNAAKYAGMNEKRNIMLSMAIAGGLAAIGASLYYLNGGAELAWNTYSKLPDNGFNGIPVALLAGNNPIGVIFSSIFLRYIDKGGYNLAGFTAYNEYVSDLIIAVIIYFAGFSMLIKGLIVKLRAKASEKAALVEGKPEREEYVTDERGESIAKETVKEESDV